MRLFYETKNQGASVRLFREDCTRGMREQVEPCSVDVVVTSPPYNIGVRYSSYQDRLPRNEYLDWIETVTLGIKRVMSSDGSLFLNIGSIPTDPWTPLDVAQKVRSHLVLQNVIHWIKSIAISKNNTGENLDNSDFISAGHYKPIGGTRFVNDSHEYIFHFTKTGRVPLDRRAVGVPYQDKSNIGRWKSAKDDVHCRGNTWFIPYQTIQSRERDRPHPSTFPDRLAEMCYRLHGVRKTKLAMDPFVGIGSSAVAARRLAIPFIGFDVDPAYLSEAKRRVDAMVSETRPNRWYGQFVPSKQRSHAGKISRLENPVSISTGG